MVMMVIQRCKNAGQMRIYTFLAVCESHVMFHRRWTRTSLSTTSRSCSAATGASSAIRHSDMFSGGQAWQTFHQKFDPKIATTLVNHSHWSSWRLEALPRLFAIDSSQFFCHTDDWQLPLSATKFCSAANNHLQYYLSTLHTLPGGAGGREWMRLSPFWWFLKIERKKSRWLWWQVSVFRKIILTNFLPTKMCLWHKGSEIQLPTLFSFDLWLWQKVYIVDQQFCTTWNKTKLEDHDRICHIRLGCGNIYCVWCRLEIFHDQRSIKFFSSCVNFSRKQRLSLQSLCKNLLIYLAIYTHFH